jgi:cytosine/adenosine deaminase-related metal-dependent hydrolase
MDKGIEIKKKSEEFNFETYITPHSTYSLSEDLFQSIMNLNESLQSIHFNETNSENDFFTKNQGELFDLMKKFRNENPINRTFKDPTNKIAQNLNPNATIALVHNTYTTKEEIDFLVKIFNKLFFIFCPNANLFIENKLPKFEYFLQHKVKIAIGTDSLASNDQLSIWEEISTIYKNSKTFSLHELIAFACGNGAKLIGKSNYLGLIKQGFKPGIVEVDLNFNRDAKRLI